MFSKKLVIIQILASAVFFSTAAAAPLTFNVDGVISDSSDQPLTSASVTFTVQVKDSAETCLLYQETFPVSMTGSNGYFSLVVGKQTNGVSGGSTLDKVFSNSGAVIPGQSCTYTPTSKTETRKIIVSFDEGSGSQIFTSQEIQSVPYAVAAGEATKFTGSLSGDVTGSQTASVVGKIKGLPVDTTGIADGKILKYQSGSFVVSDDLQGTSGIVSLNGLTGGTQTFSAVDITGSVLAPAWVSSGSAHTLKIPMASGTSVTGGLISNSDFANFSTKITALTGDITASGSGTVNAVIGAGKVTSSHILDGTINGADVDFTATNSATSDLVLKDSGTGKFATFACSTPNYVLTWTAAGWSCQAPATTGLPLSGGTMTGAISMGSNNLLNVGNLTMVAGGYLTLPNTATNGTSAGQVWYDAGVIKYHDGSVVKTLNTGSSGMSNALSTGQIWVGNVSGGAEARSLTGDISSVSSTGGVVVNKTTTGTANTILSLDGSSVGTMSGLALVNTGTVTMQASTASSTYSLKLPAASPTGTQIMQVDGLGNLTWIATPSFTMPALSAGKIWIGNASNGFQAQAVTGDATIDQTGNLVLSNTTVTAGTYTKVTTDAKGRITSGSSLASGDVTTALGYTPLNKAADTMSGDLGTQNINMAANKYLKLSANGTDGTLAGQMWYDGGVIKYFDGTIVKSLGVAGAGITSLNGLSGATQTFGVGTAGSDLNISSSGNGHIFNLPSASGSNRGALTSADWLTFNAKQSNALNAGDVWIGNASGGAQARTITGDITVDSTGNAVLKSTGTAGTYFKVTTDAQGRVASGSALASGDVTTALGFTPAASGASMTSLNGLTATSQTFGTPGTAGTAPAWSFAGSTHTLNIPMANTASVTAGLISKTEYDTFNAKQGNGLSPGFVWVGNTSGGAQGRALSGDITIDNVGLVTLKNIGVVSTYSKVVIDPQGRVTSGSALAAGDITTALGYTPANSASTFINGGNTFAGNATIGVNDAFTLGFKTNSAVRMTIDATGNVGIGTVTPAYPLSVNGTIESKSGGFRFPDGTTQTTAAATSANTILNGGNTFAAATTIGTNDAFNLGFKTGGTTRVTIDTAGKVGIGTASPNATLDMSAQTDAIILPKGTAGNRPGTLVAGMVRYNTSNNAIEYYDGTTWYTVGNALGFTPLNKAGDTMSGALSMGGSNNIIAVNSIGVGTASPSYSLDFNGKTDAIRLPSGTTGQQPAAAAGLIRYNTSNNNVEFNNGTTWTALAAAGAGITSLNGLTTATQTFGIGTTGNSPNFASAGNGHILHIPMANTSSVTAGLISKTEFDLFNAKQSTALASGQVWVGNASGAAEGRVLSGDVASVSNVGLVIVDKTTTGVANKILSLDGNGVALVRGLDVQTGTGKVTFQTAGAFSSYVLTLPNTSGSANQVMANDGAGNLSWVTPLSSSTGFVNGGNTFTGNATIGLNDNFNLGFKTNAATRMTITSAGNVGIGTATPSGTLEVQGGTAAASTAGNAITLVAQNGGSGTAAGGNINLTPGAGSGGFPGGSVVVSTAAGANGAIVATNNMTNSYTASSASSTNPSYVLRLANSNNSNANTALIETSLKNSSAIFQESYMGFVSVTGAANYSSDFVMGMSTGSTAYTERLRVVGSSGNVGIGTSSPSYSLDFNGKTDAIRLPSGTTAQQPVNAAGLIRYNTTNNNVEFNNGSVWTAFSTGSALPAIASAQVWVGNASAGPEARTLSGDVTISNVGLVTLKNTGTVGTYTKVITDQQGRVTFGSALASGDVTTALGFTPANGTTAFANGGNTFAGNATVGLNDNFNLGFKTNSTTRMTLTGAGNLGIGTATPGAYRTLIQGTTGTNVLGITDGTATAAFYVESGLSPSAPVQLGTTTNHNLGFFTNNTAPTMTLSTGGNLGIGVDSANYSLDISGRTDAIRLPMGTTAQRPAGNITGLLRYNTANLNLEFNNGSTWTALGASGGITALNGLTGTTQTFATPGTSGTAPAWSFAGSTHTLNIPMANTTSVTAGLISKTEYDNFNSKMNSSLAPGSIFIGNASGGAVGVGISGDATIASNGILTVNKTTTGTANGILALSGTGIATAYGLDIKGATSGTVSLLTQASTSSYPLRLPASSPSANQIMVSDGSGNLSWAANPSLGYTPVNKAGDTMTGTLEVSGNIQTNQGQVYASQNLISTGGTVDFNTGNVQILQAPGGATITLNNMKDGGSYTVIVADPTSRQYTFTNCTNPHFVPANDLTTAGAQSIYTILKVTIGGATHCYISWVTGF